MQWETRMKTFLQVITENTCQWPVDDLWCGKPIQAGARQPYCQAHAQRSLSKRAAHLEMVEILNSAPAKIVNQNNGIQLENSKKQLISARDTRPKHALGSEASARSRQSTQKRSNFDWHAGVRE